MPSHMALARHCRGGQGHLLRVGPLVQGFDDVAGGVRSIAAAAQGEQVRLQRLNEALASTWLPILISHNCARARINNKR